MPSRYLEVLNHSKFLLFQWLVSILVTTVTALSKSSHSEGIWDRHPQSLTLMICPRTNDTLRAFLICQRSPEEVIAVCWGVVLCDSSMSSKNQQFKTVQHLTREQSSDTVENPTYPFSCKAYFQTPGGRIPVHTLFNFKQREILSRDPQVNGKLEDTTARFPFKQKPNGSFDFFQPFPILFAVKSIFQILQICCANLIIEYSGD